jgi:hypothetical protein
MCNRDILQSTVPMISTFVLCLHNGNGGCTIQTVMEVVCLCEKFRIDPCIELEWLVTFVWNTDGALVFVRCNMPRNLNTREAGNLPDVPLYNLLVCPLESHVLESDQGRTNPLRTLFAREWPEREGETAIEEFPDTLDGFQ